MKSKTVSTSPRFQKFKKQKHKTLRRKIFLWFFAVSLFFLGLTFLSRIEKINIGTVEITGNKVLESGAIEEVVRDKIAGYYLWFFPKANFLLYPDEKIAAELAERFKRLESISLNLKDFKTLEVYVTERIPVYMWCGESLASAKEKCYFMDEIGYIFDEAPYFSGEVYFKFYGKLSAESESPLGLYFAPENFARLASFKKLVEKMGLKPAVFYLDEKGDARMYLPSFAGPVLERKTGPEIIFNIEDDLSKVAENLQSILSTEPLQTDFKKKYSSLLYIDLRFGNKVYYKFR